MEVEVSVRPPTRPTGYEDILAEVIRHVAREELADRSQECEVGLMLVGPAEIRALNRRWRGTDEVTDVLAFPTDTPQELPPGMPVLLGDVVLCPDYIAGPRTSPRLSALAAVVAHGMLHLLGYDHERPEDRAVMLAKQERYAKEAVRQ